jgi:cyclophilin family peptidyl-prolyl cis-trans isomerase
MKSFLPKSAAFCALMLLSSALWADTRTSQEVQIGGQAKPAQTQDSGFISQEIELNSNPKVELTTSKGVIVIELFPDKAPVTVKNFLAYVESGHYSNTVFHRVVRDLLIQGGAYTPALQPKADRGYIRSEANNGLSNRRGTVAAARRGNDSESAGSQFFINVVDNPQFDFTSTATMSSRGYAVFGQVIKGQDIVDAIRLVPVKPVDKLGGHVPKTPIIISQARVLD